MDLYYFDELGIIRPYPNHKERNNMSINNLRNTVLSNDEGNLRADSKQDNSKKITVYWLDGVREVLEGRSAGDAMARAGYGHGVMTAVDFIANGDDKSYEWINGRWVKKAGL